MHGRKLLLAPTSPKCILHRPRAGGRSVEGGHGSLKAVTESLKANNQICLSLALGLLLREEPLHLHIQFKYFLNIDSDVEKKKVEAVEVVSY